jgi:putative ABC transport system permease protein
MTYLPLGWLQLRHQPSRLAVALGGIAFAVVLVHMQLGFRTSLFESAVRYHERLIYDIAILSIDSPYLGRTASFSSRRLYQTLADPAVVSVHPVYVFMAIWRNPFDYGRRSVLTFGVDPASVVLETPGVQENLPAIQRRDAVLFDRRSRPEYGEVEAALRGGQRLFTEVNDREVEVVATFAMGTSFGIDASLLTSDTNFLRLFPDRRRTQIDLGLVRIRPDAQVDTVRDRLRALLPDDVLVLTRSEYRAREVAYWNSTTPVGYIFAFGAVMGLVVGAIIVYQILFADVADHLSEYATLKAMGYSNNFLCRVVFEQAVILAALGYAPGLLVALWLFEQAGKATQLPIEMTVGRAVGVLALTIVMCVSSGFLALRKVRRLDPAEVF